MMSFYKFGMLSLCFFFAGHAASAQQPVFEEVESAVNEKVAEIERFQLLLQNPDQRAQYAAVEQMLALEDPALQRIAKDHALFSTNPVIREAAIKAILDAGTTLRMQVFTDGQAEAILDWLYRAGGSHDGSNGTALIKVREALSEDCWGSRSDCQFRHVGTSVQYNSFVPNTPVRGVFDLGDDGVLRGTLNYRGERAAATIDLKE